MPDKYNCGVESRDLPQYREIDTEKNAKLFDLLHSVPTGISNNRRFGRVNKEYLVESPAYSGELTKVSFGTQKRKSSPTGNYYYALHGTNLYYFKSKGSKKPKGVIPIAFCTVDRLNETLGALPCLPETKENVEEVPRFRVYTDSRVLFFQTKDEESLQEWVSHIAENLANAIGESKLEAKAVAAVELEGFLASQLQERQAELVRLDSILSQPGTVHVKTPLADPEKQKEGYLQIRKKDNLDGDSRWNKYLVVLLRGFLYYYRNSLEEEPAGILNLKRAQMKITRQSVESGRNTIVLRTAFRTLEVRAKHEVAAASWCQAFDAVTISYARKRAIARGDDSVLSDNKSSSRDEQESKSVEYNPTLLTDGFEQYKIPRSWDKLSDFLQDKRGRHYFNRFLHNEGFLNLYKFIRDANNFANHVQQHEEQLALDLEVVANVTSSALQSSEDDDGETETNQNFGNDLGEGKQHDSNNNLNKGVQHSPREKAKDLAARNQSFRRESQRIYDRYIKEDSDKEIRMLSGERSQVAQAISDESWNCVFGNCNSIVYHYLESQLLPRFLSGSHKEEMNLSTRSPLQRAEPVVGPKFLVIEFQKRRRCVQLKKLQTVLGRDSTCDVVLDDPSASRSHCEIRIDDHDRCIMSDLGSTRGIRLNGVKVIQCGLRLEDVVVLGDTKVMLSDIKK